MEKTRKTRKKKKRKNPQILQSRFFCNFRCYFFEFLKFFTVCVNGLGAEIFPETYMFGIKWIISWVVWPIFLEHLRTTMFSSAVEGRGSFNHKAATQNSTFAQYQTNRGFRKIRGWLQTATVIYSGMSYLYSYVATSQGSQPSCKCWWRFLSGAMANVIFETFGTKRKRIPHVHTWSYMCTCQLWW